MRMSVFTRHLYTADYYTFTLEQNPLDQTTTRVYSFSHTIECTIGTDGTLARINVYVDDSLDKGGHLSNIRDRAGNLIYQNDQTLTINTIEPRLNVFGITEGYRLRCT